MARTGVTYDDVNDAASSLVVKGISPTVIKIRSFLGAGSHTTIGKHLKEWRSTQQDKHWVSLPKNMPQSLQPLIEELWLQALKQASTHFHEEKLNWRKTEGSLSAMVKSFEEELNKTIDANQQQQKTINRLRDHLNKAQLNLREKNDQIKKLKAQIKQVTGNTEKD